MTPNWLSGVHHDGSSRYVSNPLPALNETVTVWLRVPRTAPVTAVYLRTIPDGEQHLATMTHHHSDRASHWWRGTLTMINRRMGYRFKLLTADGAWHINALGSHQHEPASHHDFKLLADFAAPDWVTDTVFYQIFPDRFHNGDPALNPPPGQEIMNVDGHILHTTLRPWHQPPLPYNQGGMVDFYGGDLPGIQQKLGYLTDLGVNGIYLNPIFTASSNHKYNTRDFYNVDPHFGGNDALIALRQALTAQKMRLLLDITPNHCGHDHPWFTVAQADPTAETAAYFTFHHHPDNYESWLGVRSLPKFNYASPDLRQRMIEAEDAILTHWLRPPYSLDGWRLDVWNMTARQGGTDHSRAIAHAVRAHIKALNPAAYLLAENFFDATDMLQGDDVDAAMNYFGFSYPIWRWLAGHDLVRPATAADPHLLPTSAAATQIQQTIAAIPWAIARMQFNQLGSHDTPRILSVLGDNRDKAQLAAALLFTFPGVPCIYYGDEIGLTGWGDSSNRAPMPWDPAQWDGDLRATYQQLIHLRRTAPALRDGGFQILHAHGDILAFQRHSPNDRLLTIAHRGDIAQTAVSLPVWHAGLADGDSLTNIATRSTHTVQNGTLLIDPLPANTAVLFREQ